MSDTIDQSFVDQFESDVHMAYQRMGSKLRNTVRNKNNIRGQSTTMQKIGKGTAGTKSRHGQVPVMNLDHTPVKITLEDHYAGEYIDKLDELKINHDEKMVASDSIAGAMGRKTDSIIVAEMDAATANQTATTGAVTLAKIEEIFEHMGDNDVPDDGQRFLGVSPQGWTDLLGLTQFASTDYVPESELPYKGAGMTAKKWNSFFVFMFSGFSKTSNVRTSMAWHKTAIGHASGAELNLDVTWQGKEQANLAVGSLSQGAKVIDATGVYQLRHTES